MGVTPTTIVRHLSGGFIRTSIEHEPEAHAIIHTHSEYATALACTREDLPAFHYMVAIAGGDRIKCCDYALFGSEELCQ